MKLYLAYLNYVPEDNEEHSERIIGVYDSMEKAREALNKRLLEYKEDFMERFGDRWEYFLNKEEPRVVEFVLNKDIKYGYIL